LYVSLDYAASQNLSGAALLNLLIVL